MKAFARSNILLTRKITYTLGILLIYMIGRNIPLPLVDLDQILSQNQASAFDFMSAALAATAGDLSRTSILTMGIGPMMSSMIIMRFLMQTDWLKKKKLSLEETDRWKRFLMLIIAIIQAFGLAFTYPLLDGSTSFFAGEWPVRSAIALFLMAGSFFTIWLSNQNVMKGIGSILIFIIAGILDRLIPNSAMIFAFFRWGQAWHYQMLSIVLIYSILTMILMVFLSGAERRLPLRRVRIENKYNNQSYLPLKVNAGGGMAIMYSMSLMALPQYLLQFLNVVFPESQILQELMGVFNTNQLSGSLIYILLVFLLAIGLAFINVDPHQTAERLMKAGDYIVGVRPGRPTEDYISHKVWLLSIVGGTFMALSVGLPHILAVFYPVFKPWVSVPSSAIILTSLVIEILKEIKAYWQKGLYTPLFD